MLFYGIIIAILHIPLPANQHYVWPLSMCVLADICNHTWIPECGRETEVNTLRLFIDECDLYEYACDNDEVYEIVNYSKCFSGVQTCPPVIPCPSKPTCPNHAFHRMGQHYLYITQARRMALTPHTTTTQRNLPKHMLKGKRRHTPIPRCYRGKNRAKTTIRRTIPKNKNIKPTHKFGTTKKMTVPTKRDTIILKKETVLRNGKIYLKVVKGFAPMVVTTTDTKADSDFLEK